MTDTEPVKRTLYVSYVYMKPGTEQHFGGSDVTLYEALDTGALNTMHDVLAAKCGVEPGQLIVTFFAELEN